MSRKVTKAIFPVAGLGTRFLPATKSIPKEIMTLVDRPLIQYAIDEARAAGIKEFIFVTSRGKGALEDYFDHAHELEANLQESRQGRAAGHAARHQHGIGRHRLYPPAPGAGPWPCGLVRPPPVGDEPFAVLLTDDVIAARTALPATDGRGLWRDRRQHGRHDGSRPGQGLVLRRSGRRGRHGRHRPRQGHGRKAEGRDRARRTLP